MIGDCKTAALVGRDGSIDWLCWPRFNFPPACFAALLGTPENGRWLLAAAGSPLDATRRYRPGTLILETEFQTETGFALIVDFMHPLDGAADLVRIVVGRSGQLMFRTELVVRFDYGATVPWVSRAEDGTIDAIAGPVRLVLRTPTALYGEDLKTVGEFIVDAGQSVPFVLSHGASVESLPAPIDPFAALERTKAFWSQWSDRCPQVGPWTDAVKRSLITLKALTYAPTGGIVAAPTASLPERFGRYAELGLPILLVARRHLYALGLHAPRILRRSTGMERLAYPGDCRQPGPGPDYVRGGRGTMVAGNEYSLAARL